MKNTHNKMIIKTENLKIIASLNMNTFYDNVYKL